MEALHKPQELVEKIILETRPIPWVTLSIGGCGILTRAIVWRDGYGGGHDENYMGSRSFGLEFAYSVLHAIGLSAAHRPTLGILVDTAAALNNGSRHVALSCTTWQCLPEGVEICSVGTTSVLVFEEGAIREAIIPHSIRELLRG